MKTIFNPGYGRMIESFKHRRQELGLTQEQVSRGLRRSRTWVGKVEQCERRLDVIEVRDLCDLYGMDISEIISGLTEEEHP